MKRGLSIAVLVAAVVVILALVMNSGGTLGGNTSAAAGSSEPMVTVTDQSGNTMRLPLVTGGDRTQPMSAAQANADSRTPAVSGGTITNSWGALDSLMGGSQTYTNCVNNVTGIHWSQDVPHFESTEQTLETGDDMLILASNTTASDTQIRETAASGVPVESVLHQKILDASAQGLPIWHVQGFVNTRHLTGDCQQFYDARPQVRPTLGVIEYDAQGAPTGLKQDRGVFTNCHNPWEMATVVQSTVPQVPAITTNRQTTPGQPGCQGNGCTTVPNCTMTGSCVTTTTLESKNPHLASGQGGVGDGGSGEYGGPGGQRLTITAPATPPGAGNPPATRPTPTQPQPNPVPSGTPTQQPVQPTATGAQPPSAPQTTCVDPPGYHECG